MVSVTQVVNAVSQLPPWAVYAVVTALAFGESSAFVGLVLPGETALLLGGVLAATGRVGLAPMIGLAILAAVAGDSVGYEIGRLGGTTLRNSRAGRFVGAARWRRAEAFMTRRGGWAVFTGRWIGVMRALVPTLAGMSGMNYRRFVIFNTVGGTLWATTVVAAGYFAGTTWQQVQAYLGWFGGVLLLVLVTVAVATALWRRLMRGRRAAMRARRGPAGIDTWRTVRRWAGQLLVTVVRRLRSGTVFSPVLTLGVAMVVGAVAVAFAGLVEHFRSGGAVAGHGWSAVIWLAAHWAA